MGQVNTVPRRINGVEGAAGQVILSGGPGVIETWGAPAPAAHTHAAGDVTSGQFPLARMPRGAVGHVITGTGAGTDPVYATPAAPSAHESTHVSGGSDDIDSALALAAMADLTTDKIWKGVAGRPAEVVMPAPVYDYDSMLSELMDGNLYVPDTLDWTEVLVNGNVSQQKGYVHLGAGAGANGSALIHNNKVYLFNPNIYGWSSFDWESKILFSFLISRSTDTGDANYIAYAQLKAQNVIGDMAAKGFGIKIKDLAVFGVSYGTARAEINLAFNMTAGYPIKVDIVRSSETIKWYIEGVLKGTQSTAANIPSANSIAYLVFSIQNGAGGVNAAIYVNTPILWQKRP